MSIDIDWDALTTGEDGLALAEIIRNFIHDRFQQTALPRFISSVHVHSFEFGSVCPEIALKDICDPFPEFYEDLDEEYDSEDSGGEEGKDGSHSVARPTPIAPQVDENKKARSPANIRIHDAPSLAQADTRTATTSDHHIFSPVQLGPSAPGIPGGTSNLSYFHNHITASLSGTHTPLAAVAGGGYHWSHETENGNTQERYNGHSQQPSLSTTGSSAQSRPSTGGSVTSSPVAPTTLSPQPEQKVQSEPDAEDIQLVFHVRYAGDVHLSLTANLLLDYPMPSFVNIPVKLRITSLVMDGVGILAYLRKRGRVGFCFLGPEEAEMALTNPVSLEDTVGESQTDVVHPKPKSEGGILRDIRVESEIGDRKESTGTHLASAGPSLNGPPGTSGGQVLKNVGKLEKFVLEQVRRIVEEELVWPSFWTFLV